ncbi:FAD-dependent oxidoreductase [Roseiconus lacunae]|uniref:FAD-dependent oxidoreductase n=1 Tax=Roseiconus lacunae TaxID=2605694 RepID=UPI0021BC9B7B|nr:FAD-dependent oxidoreductase [Roseiconus lacunae]
MIVGGGMSGFGLCDRLVRAGTHQDYDITLIGEEPTPAYDRVNLSRYFKGSSTEDLLLAPRSWYASNEIKLRTGARVVRIDRYAKQVHESSGEVHSYDQLVIATGSHPFIPPIDGHDSDGVFVYRTIDDLRAIKSYCQSKNAERGAVIGGGLLGLEAAKMMLDLGISVSVIEMAPGLMPRQLDANAAKLLERKIAAMGVEVHLVRRTESIQRENDRLRLCFANADDMTVDVLIVAAGVRPNDQLAEEAGLKIGPRRGIEIDDSLQTSDPNIFAIGECASFNEHVFGLVAPCYRMSDVLASRFAGHDLRFAGADESAELKLMGIQVATLGKTIGESAGGSIISHEDSEGRRELLIERGRIVGASCVGPWTELPQIRQAITRQARLWPWQRSRFEKSGTPWNTGGALPVIHWPPDSIVCSCLSVTKETISDLVAKGHQTAESIANSCGASTACGSCRSLVCELAGTSGQQATVPWARTMLATSALASVVVLAWLFVGPIPTATSVQEPRYAFDSVMRSDLGRQISGFGLLGTTLVGLTFSLRKRLSRFTWGSYGFWRAMHGLLGTAVLLGMVAHTGLRLGSNLNFLLGTFFLSTIMVGGIAGVISSIESRLTGTLAMTSRIWRQRLTRVHLWITWPLPILISLHVLSFYWFRD